jgi:quinol monooxygenase YgiN
MMTTPAAQAHISEQTVFLVFLPVKPEARDKFRRMLAEVGEHIAKEPDFIGANIYEDVDDPDTLILHETWKGTREGLAEQLKRPYRKTYESLLSELLKSPRRIVFLNSVGAVLGRT